MPKMNLVFDENDLLQTAQAVTALNPASPGVDYLVNMMRRYAHEFFGDPGEISHVATYGFQINGYKGTDAMSATTIYIRTSVQAHLILSFLAQKGIKGYA